MKSVFFLFFLHVSLLSFSQLEDPFERNLPNYLKVKPINLLGGQLNLNYERVFTNRITTEFSYGHWFGVEADDDNVFGNNFGVNPRYYFKKNKFAPEDYYAGVYLNYNILDVKSNNDSDALQLFEKGVLIGRQWLQDNGIVIDLNTGIAHLGTNLEDIEDSDDYEDDLPKFLPKVGASIGYSF